MTDHPGRFLAATLALAAAAWPAAARAQNEACLGQDRNLVVLDETLLALTEPLGVENQLSVYDCEPLIRRPGVLFKLTSLEIGVSTLLAPAYANAGAFVRVTPLSILRLKAEIQGVGYWPFPLDAAGYFPVQGYGARFSGQDLPSSKAASIDGFRADAEATLQLEVGLTDWAGVAAQDVFTVEHWRVGKEPHYFNMRADLVLAAADTFVENVAVVLAYFRLRDDVTLRVGPIDDFKYVPSSGYRAHALGGVALLELKGVLRGGNVTPFVRLDGYLEHRFRSGVNFFAGVGGSWELGWSPSQANAARGDEAR